MPSEPIPITDVFVHVTKQLLDSHGEADPKEIYATIASEYGIPVDSLNVALKKHVEIAMLFAFLTTPTRAMTVSMQLAFVAGVAWEQGRNG